MEDDAVLDEHCGEECKERLLYWKLRDDAQKDKEDANQEEHGNEQEMEESSQGIVEYDMRE